MHPSRRYLTRSVTGTVVGADAYRDALGGDEAMAPFGGPAQAPKRASSRAARRARFFLRDDDYREVEVTLDGHPFAVRDGHRLTAVYAGPASAHALSLLMVYNHDTDRWVIVHRRLKRMLPSVWMIALTWTVLIVTVFPGPLLALAAAMAPGGPLAGLGVPMPAMLAQLRDGVMAGEAGTLWLLAAAVVVAWCGAVFALVRTRRRPLEDRLKTRLFAHIRGRAQDRFDPAAQSMDRPLSGS